MLRDNALLYTEIWIRMPFFSQHLNVYKMLGCWVSRVEEEAGPVVLPAIGVLVKHHNRDRTAGVLVKHHNWDRTAGVLLKHHNRDRAAGVLVKHHNRNHAAGILLKHHNRDHAEGVLGSATTETMLHPES